MTEHHEVVVIGGGQAGLAIGYLLAQQGRRFTILEAADEPAAAWRDPLGLAEAVHAGALRQPARAARSPATPTATPAATTSSPTSRDYARDFELPVELNSRVAAVRRARRRLPGRARRPHLRSRPGRGRHRALPGRRSCRRSPPASAPDVAQLHSSDYRPPSDAADGPVLVVGGGNTRLPDRRRAGAHRTRCTSSIGARQTPLPQRIARPRHLPLPRSDRADGQDRELADRPAHAGPRDADRLEPARRAPAPGIQLLHGRTVAASGPRVTLRRRRPAGSRAPSSGRPASSSTTRCPAARLRRRRPPRAPARRHRVTGLYFLGLPWQHTRGSALLGWVKDDAEYLALQISATPPKRAPIEPGAPRLSRTTST